MQARVPVCGMSSLARAMDRRCLPRRLLLTAGVGLVVAGCAGSGEGLDENGRPTDGTPPPLTADFDSIQDHVLTPFCTVCHSGASAPLGLRLEAEVSYAMLVDAPSAEVPALQRVAPGNPDASYLVQKLEGTAAVGDRMPLDAPALPRSTIEVIRQWIVDGALPAGNDAAASKPIRLTAIEPLPGAVLHQRPPTFVIAANGELDATRLDAGSVRVERRDGGTGDGAGWSTAPGGLRIELRSLSPTIVVVEPVADAWTVGHYRLVVAGSGSSAATGRDARTIDGDGDGAPGGDFTLEFSLVAPP